MANIVKVLMCIGVVWGLMSAPVNADDTSTADPTEGNQRQASADRPAQLAMSELATQCEFGITPGDDLQVIPLTLREQPLIRYGDETREISDSSLWVWMNGNLPAMFQKIEINNWGGGRLWTWCFASAVSQPLECRWRDIVQKSRKTDPCFEYPVPGDPSTNGNIGAWKLAARQINRQFSVTGALNKNVLRPMPRPLMEFQAEQQDVLYGAIFAYATGTNPDFLLQLSLRKTDNGPQWVYRPIHMTSVHINLFHQGEEVWKDDNQKSGEVSTWGYFFSPRAAGID